MVDWGLPLNSVRFDRVTAVDRAGNESLPVSPVKVGPRIFKPVSIQLTAENARVEGMSEEPVKSVIKNGATKVLSAITKEGKASWDFEIPRDGKYAIWVLSLRHQLPVGPQMQDARVSKMSGSNESIFNIESTVVQ